MASLKDIVIYAGVFIAGMVFHAQVQKYVNDGSPIHPASRPVPSVPASAAPLHGSPVVASSFPTTERSAGSATLQHFNQIQAGMTYADVLGIVGAEGKETMQYELMGNLSEHFEWKGAGRGYGSMTVFFENGYVTDKMHIGLK